MDTTSSFFIYFLHIFFIYSSFDGPRGCFHILAITSNAAMNTGVHASVEISAFVFFE